MKRNHKSAKDAGQRFNRSIADYLRIALDDDRIDCRAKRGSKDRGDIGGMRVANQRMVIECKDVRHEYCTKCRRVSGLALPGWTAEAHIEAGNDDALVGVVVHKRHGVSDPGKQWVSMTVDDLLALVAGERFGHRRELDGYPVGYPELGG